MHTTGYYSEVERPAENGHCGEFDGWIRITGCGVNTRSVEIRGMSQRLVFGFIRSDSSFRPLLWRAFRCLSPSFNTRLAPLSCLS